MSFYGAVRLLVIAWADRRAHQTSTRQEQPLPEIPPGRFAAWAREWSARPAAPAAPGRACRTADGREGVLVEVFAQGRTTLVCTPA